jgi:hypothetical protein
MDMRVSMCCTVERDGNPAKLADHVTTQYLRADPSLSNHDAPTTPHRYTLRRSWESRRLNTKTLTQSLYDPGKAHLDHEVFAYVCRGVVLDSVLL